MQNKEEPYISYGETYFCKTVTLSNGVPIETVSKMLGHTKLATTQIYTRVLKKKVSEDMLTLRSKLKTELDSLP